MRLIGGRGFKPPRQIMNTRILSPPRWRILQAAARSTASDRISGALSSRRHYMRIPLLMSNVINDGGNVKPR